MTVFVSVEESNKQTTEKDGLAVGNDSSLQSGVSSLFGFYNIYMLDISLFGLFLNSDQSHSTSSASSKFPGQVPSLVSSTSAPDTPAIQKPSTKVMQFSGKLG